MTETLAVRITRLLESVSGLTDGELTDHLLGPGSPQQAINQACRQLRATGRIERRTVGGLIRNYLIGGAPTPPVESALVSEDRVDSLSEDALKRALESYLRADGWTVTTIWGRGHGIDVEARRGNSRWVIEVKGRGSRNAMRVNYFLAILGELLQRMSDADAHYSIALPDLPQYRGLWNRLPALSKERTTISALFIADTGVVTEEG